MNPYSYGRRRFKKAKDVSEVMRNVLLMFQIIDLVVRLLS